MRQDDVIEGGVDQSKRLCAKWCSTYFGPPWTMALPRPYGKHQTLARFAQHGVAWSCAVLYIIVQQNYSILQHSAYAARYITLQYHCTTRSTGIQEYSSSNYRTQCLRCTVVLHISKYRGCATMQYSTVVGVLCYVVLRVGTALCSNPQRCVQYTSWGSMFY